MAQPTEPGYRSHCRGDETVSINPALHQRPIINCDIQAGATGTFSGPPLPDGPGTGRIELDGGVTVCGSFCDADACAMDTREGRLVAAGNVTSNIEGDVDAGCVFFYGGDA